MNPFIPQTIVLLATFICTLSSIPRVKNKIFLIHSADDRNATTPLQGEQQLYAAAGAPKQQWIAPSGGHVGAISAHKAEYEQRVLAFFARYLKSK